MLTFNNAWRVIGRTVLLAVWVAMVVIPDGMAQEIAPGLRAVPSALLSIDQNRTTVVDRIIADWGDALTKSNAGITVDQLRLTLLSMRSDYLLAASVAGSLDGLRRLVASSFIGSAPASEKSLGTKALGDTSDDLVYTPVAPCRILDTRNGTVPPYNAQMVGGAAFPVAANLPNFSPQGGSATNCNLPASFQAVVVTLTVLNPNFDAFLAASNSSNFATLTQSVVMDFSANKGLATTVPVLVDGTVKFYLGLPAQVTTNVIADIVGYFAAPVATAVQCAQVTSASTPIAVSSDTLVALPSCATGYTRTGTNCAGPATTPSGYLIETNTTGCVFRNLSSVATYNATATSTCCRVPGR